MKDRTPAWAMHLEANAANLADELPPADPRKVKRFVTNLNTLAATPDHLERARRGGRQLPIGYEHVLVTMADGDLADMASARRLGAVRVGDFMGTLTAYGRKTYAAIELLPDEDHRSGVLRLLVTGGDYPLKADATSDARKPCATAPS